MNVRGEFNKFLITLVMSVVFTIAVQADIPGPDYLFECPKCSAPLKVGSLISGNTFGATTYSDGKMIAPMLPNFPDLTKCKKCNAIFWLSEMEAIGTCDQWKDDYKPACEDADDADFLDITDLFRSLGMDNVKNDKKKEINVRIQIWWAFNDRIRKGDNLFAHEKDKDLWNENCRKLIKLFDEKDVDQKIMIAELYRNLGDFKKSLKILNSIDNKDYDWVIKKLLNECKKRNTLLIRLNNEDEEEAENFQEDTESFDGKTVIIASILFIGLIGFLILLIIRQKSKKIKL